VEKTALSPRQQKVIEKHLHGRGEDGIEIKLNSGEGETPPRAWRRPAPEDMPQPSPRNTSTGVEKTLRLSCAALHNGKHLHGRGEDCGQAGVSFVKRETPPRAWRRPF